MGIRTPGTERDLQDGETLQTAGTDGVGVLDVVVLDVVVLKVVELEVVELEVVVLDVVLLELLLALEDLHCGASA